MESARPNVSCTVVCTIKNHHTIYSSIQTVYFNYVDSSARKSRPPEQETVFSRTRPYIQFLEVKLRIDEVVFSFLVASSPVKGDDDIVFTEKL